MKAGLDFIKKTICEIGVMGAVSGVVKKNHASIFVALSGLTLSLPCSGLGTANYSDATNERFTNDPSFIGSGFDLSGVGRVSSEFAGTSSQGRWATAIGENYFLSANHFKPETSTSITFYDGNSTGSPSFTYMVGGGFRVGSTDLWVGYTLEAIDPSIARYGYTTQDADTLNELGLGDSTLYMNGDRVGGEAGLVTDHVLGTNQAESFYNEGSGQFQTPGLTVNFEPPAGFENDMIILFEHLTGDDNPPLFHESLVGAGDSGSPLFSASGGNLTVLGVGSLRGNDIPGNFVDSPGPSPIPDSYESRNASFYSYVGSYTSQLDAAIAQVPPPIPEPASALLLAPSLMLALRRRR